MPYAKLAYNCCPMTMAITDNQKYFKPGDKLYNQRLTHMLQYPGFTADFITAVGDVEHPEEIKNYFGKSWIKSPEDTANAKPKISRQPDPIETSCPNCWLLRANA